MIDRSKGVLVSRPIVLYCMQKVASVVEIVMTREMQKRSKALKLFFFFSDNQ
jgi:hypothetical protein